MWRIWLIFDPRRLLIGMFIFVFAMVMLLHFIVLSDPYWGGFLGWGVDPAASASAASFHHTPLPASGIAQNLLTQ